MEAAGALASLAPSPITVLGLIPLLALGITYFRYQQFDPESYITEVNAVSIVTYALFMLAIVRTMVHVFNMDVINMKISLFLANTKYYYKTLLYLYLTYVRCRLH